MQTENRRRTHAQQLVELRLGEPIEQYVRRAYHVEGRSQGEIAEALGVTQATASRWMRDWGIPVQYVGRQRRRGQVA